MFQTYAPELVAVFRVGKRENQDGNRECLDVSHSYDPLRRTASRESLDVDEIDAQALLRFGDEPSAEVCLTCSKLGGE